MNAKKQFRCASIFAVLTVTTAAAAAVLVTYAVSRIFPEAHWLSAMVYGLMIFALAMQFVLVFSFAMISVYAVFSRQSRASDLLPFICHFAGFVAFGFTVAPIWIWLASFVI